jgi:hypothetical protein
VTTAASEEEEDEASVDCETEASDVDVGAASVDDATTAQASAVSESAVVDAASAAAVLDGSDQAHAEPVVDADAEAAAFWIDALSSVLRILQVFPSPRRRSFLPPCLEPTARSA